MCWFKIQFAIVFKANSRIATNADKVKWNDIIFALIKYAGNHEPVVVLFLWAKLDND